MDKRSKILSTSTLLLLLVACGGGGSDDVAIPLPVPNSPSAEGLLVPVETDEQLVDAVRFGFSQLDEDDQRAVAEAVTVDSSGFTATYNLEAGVDEHDYVKYDGEHIFIAPSRSMGCCFILEDQTVAENALSAEDASLADGETRTIRILATSPEEGSAAEVSTIELEDELSVEGLYVDEDQLVTISSSGWWGAYGDSFFGVSLWEGQNTALNIYDVSQISEPDAVLRIGLEGGFVSSRKKDDTVYLVTRHTPYIEGFTYYPTNDEERAQNDVLLDELTVDDILPRVSVDGIDSQLIQSQDCYVANAEHQLASSETGYPTMTLLIAIDLDSRSIAKSSCFLEPTDGIYVSENAIYLSYVDYSTEDVTRTLVHRYKLDSELIYEGSGAADGALYLSGNSDFRINEHNDYLRLVTTDFTDDSNDWFDHKLSIFELDSANKTLNLVSTLPNDNRTQEIGKPNENLFGVRFMGDKLFLVTFEQVDPLYVIDLSIPEDPVIAGELTIPGFSDLLHPVNEELLLGLGQNGNGLVKLELFNIADMSSPYSLGTSVLGEFEWVQWSYSEAQYNRHAFTYQANDQNPDRFLVPVTMGLFSEELGEYSESPRLYLFELKDKDDSTLASISEIGQIRAEKDWWQVDLHRSIIHDDAVYFINGTSVWSTLWTNPLEQSGPQ